MANSVTGQQYNHITSNTTTQVKSATGTLHKIVINTKGASANTLTIVDNTSGSTPVIGVVDTTSAVGDISYDVDFVTGLRIITATGTAADVTVVFN